MDIRAVSEKVANGATRLSNDQYSGRCIPWMKMILPESVEPSSRDVADVQRRRPVPPHRLGVANELAPPPQARPELGPVVRETCAQKPLYQGISRGHLEPIAVQKRAVARLSSEELVPNRVIDRAYDELAVVLQPNGYREVRVAMGVIGGSIEGVDDPTIVGTSAGIASLFGENLMVRKAAPQHRDDSVLGSLVRVCDEVNESLVLDSTLTVQLVNEHGATGTCRFYRGVEEEGWLQQILSVHRRPNYNTRPSSVDTRTRQPIIGLRGDSSTHDVTGG